MDSVRLLSVQLEEKEKNLELAAELGQLLVRENEKLKEQNENLMNRVAEETCEKRNTERLMKRLEVSHQARLDQALEQISHLEGDNNHLEKQIRALESFKKLRSKVTGLDTRHEEETESKEDHEGPEESQKLLFWSNRCKELQGQVKTGHNQIQTLSRYIEDERRRSNLLQTELAEKKRVITAVREEVKLLKERVDQSQRQLEERAQLETMVTNLTRANIQHKEELEEALYLLNQRQQEDLNDKQHEKEEKSLLEELAELPKHSSVLSTVLGGEVKKTVVEKKKAEQKQEQDQLKRENPAGSFDQDPMYFHFHMMVQTVRINTEAFLGFGPEIGGNDLSTRSLYRRALDEGVPFFEYNAFIQNAYRELVEKRFSEETSPAIREANKLLRAGAISQEEYNKIVDADKNFG